MRLHLRLGFGNMVLYGGSVAGTIFPMLHLLILPSVLLYLYPLPLNGHFLKLGLEFEFDQEQVILIF